MAPTVHSDRKAQIVAWAVAGIFILGFFVDEINSLTGPIMGNWFIGTQRLRRGFVWAVAINIVLALIFHWRRIPLTAPFKPSNIWACCCLPLRSIFSPSASIAWSTLGCRDFWPRSHCPWQALRCPGSHWNCTFPGRPLLDF